MQTELRNFSAEPESTILQQNVTEWKTGHSAGSSPAITVTLAPGETRLVQQTVSIPGQHLWSPEDPFLYLVRFVLQATQRQRDLACATFISIL